MKTKFENMNANMVKCLMYIIAALQLLAMLYATDFSWLLVSVSLAAVFVVAAFFRKSATKIVSVMTIDMLIIFALIFSVGKTKTELKLSGTKSVDRSKFEYRMDTFKEKFAELNLC